MAEEQRTFSEIWRKSTDNVTRGYFLIVSERQRVASLCGADPSYKTELLRLDKVITTLEKYLQDVNQLELKMANPNVSDEDMLTESTRFLEKVERVYHPILNDALLNKKKPVDPLTEFDFNYQK